MKELESITESQLVAVAKRYGLKEIAFFGSVLGDHFGPTSDIDVLVEFLPDANPSLYDLVDIKDELEAILQRKVDVVEKTGLRNPFRRRAILGNHKVVYAAS